MGYARRGEEIRRVEKVVIYCVRDGRLLVFRHIDYPPEVVGLQVPAGSILEGESKEVAAHRELEEQTGRKGFVITAYLGRPLYDISPYRDEIQERFFFRASAPLLIDEKWTGGENQGGGVPPDPLRVLLDSSTQWPCFAVRPSRASRQALQFTF